MEGEKRQSFQGHGVHGAGCGGCAVRGRRRVGERGVCTAVGLTEYLVATLGCFVIRYFCNPVVLGLCRGSSPLHLLCCVLLMKNEH